MDVVTSVYANVCVQVTNPATGKVIATLPLMKADETLTAIAAAHAVFPRWSSTTAKERGALLRKWVLLLTMTNKSTAAAAFVDLGAEHTSVTIRAATP